MPLATSRRTRPLDYSILHDAEPAGPSIGRFENQEFYEYVADGFGRLFVYSGIAPRRVDGEFDDDALKPGEFIVRPGLIYRMTKSTAKRRA